MARSRLLLLVPVILLPAACRHEVDGPPASGFTVEVIPARLFFSALQDRAPLFAVVRDGAGQYVDPDSAELQLEWCPDCDEPVLVSDQGEVTATGHDTGTVTVKLVQSAEVLASARATVEVRTWVSIVPGRDHTCALTSDSAAYCWGRNDAAGRLGDGRTSNQIQPVAVRSGPTRFTTIVAGANHTCALTADGAAHCWGANDAGQLGDGSVSDSRVPTRVTGEQEFAAMALGDRHSCGLGRNDSLAYCWGDNTFGQLSVEPLHAADGAGAGALLAVMPASDTLKFSRIAAGRAHTCGILVADNTARCWGSGEAGQLGTDRVPPSPVSNGSGAISFRALAAGGDLTCGIDTSGAAWCWGTNRNGPLGADSVTASRTAVQIQGGIVFDSISVGHGHVCGPTPNGAAYCWGDNTTGQLGDGGNTDKGTPGVVSGVLAFRSVRAGGGHTCGIGAREIAYCWGGDAFGQLGSGSENDLGGAPGSATPVKVVPPVDTRSR